MAFTIDDIPEELLENYKGGTCGFFVGAGLSQGAGFDDWRGLLTKLIEHTESKHLLDADKSTECKDLIKDSNKFLLVAEEIKEILGGSGFKGFLEKTFLDGTKSPQGIHDLLVSLKQSKFILTTNYDMLIEEAFVKMRKRPTVYKYYEAQAVQRSLFNRNFFILKAHGDAETAAEKIVLTERDYRNIMYKEPGYRSVLSTIFSMYSVIFLGSSLDDPELKLLLQYINAAFPDGGIQHYALMPIEEITRTERGRWLKDYNIQIVPISREDSFADLNAFLAILKEHD